MESNDPDEFDLVLAAFKEGDSGACDRLVTLIYGDLRAAARRAMSRQRPDHTLQPSALVHEVLLKLLASKTFETAQSRRHLYSSAMKAMRQVLIDHHRSRTAHRRGGGEMKRHPLDLVLDHLVESRQIDTLELNEALDRLSSDDPRAGLVVSYHFLLGMSMPEIANALDISVPTVERDWQYGRAMLRSFLEPR